MNFFRKRKEGFSLVETILAVLFLSIASIGIFSMISHSNRSSMDANLFFLANQLALEPLEVFRAFGYESLGEIGSVPIHGYEVGTWADVPSSDIGSGIERPGGATSFERKIDLTKVELSGTKGFLVSVRIRPVISGKARIFMRKEEVVRSALLLERPK